MQTLLQRIQRKVPLLIEKARGIDFVLVVQPSELGFDEKLVHRAAPSGDKFLIKVFTDLAITGSDTFLDIGCAKGSAMRCALKFPFEKVDGIELSERLSDTARANFKQLGKKNVDVFNLNAVDFDSYGRYNVIYFYNPFPESVMNLVMTRIKQQLNQQIETIVIYNNPTCHAVLIAHGLVALRDYPDVWGDGIRVYSNKPKSSRLLIRK